MDYHRFLPTSRAIVELSDPSFLNSALTSLNKSFLAGHPLHAYSSPDLPKDNQRTRGAEGRMDAIQRGAIVGNGPSGGIRPDGREVVVWGLPGKLQPNALRAYLRNLKLVEDASDGRIDCLSARVHVG